MINFQLFGHKILKFLHDSQYSLFRFICISLISNHCDLIGILMLFTALSFRYLEFKKLPIRNIFFSLFHLYLNLNFIFRTNWIYHRTSFTNNFWMVLWINLKCKMKVSCLTISLLSFKFNQFFV